MVHANRILDVPSGRPITVTSSSVDSQHPATLASSITYAPNASYTQIYFANGVRQTYAYNNRFQLCDLNIFNGGGGAACGGGTQGSGLIEDFSYFYNSPNADNGNLQADISNGNQNFAHGYTYDSLNRLYSYTDNLPTQSCKGLQWTYDAWGNMTNQNNTNGSIAA
jgi:hypothetical protein